MMKWPMKCSLEHGRKIHFCICARLHAVSTMSSSCRQSDGQQQQGTEKLHEWTMINFFYQHHQAESLAQSRSDRTVCGKNWQLFSLSLSTFHTILVNFFYMNFYSNLISSWFDCSVLFFHPPLSLYLCQRTKENQHFLLYAMPGTRSSADVNDGEVPSTCINL